MNPLRWKRNHQIALVLAIAVGASLGIVVGYLVYSSGRGAGGAISFGYWLSRPLRSAGLWWGLFGAGVGAAAIYLRRLLT